eukprot:3810169-Pyramimonas_sp.AAC.1
MTKRVPGIGNQMSYLPRMKLDNGQLPGFWFCIRSVGKSNQSVRISGFASSSRSVRRGWRGNVIQTTT